ncbi:MAG: hypothetical protein J6Q78_00760 [Clostridia bacterium]|nr:hypothetical protein [Clostridia bacterium]
MKRLVVSLLVLSMLILCFASCGDTGNGSGNGIKDNEEGQYLENIDFQGYTFRFLGGAMDSGILYDEDEMDSSSLMDQATIERDSEIIERFNISFDQTLLQENYIANFVLKDALNELSSYDLARLHGTESAAEIIAQKAAADIKKLPTIDLTQPWYQSQANDEYTIMHRQYLVAGMYPGINGSPPLVFNKSMMNEINMPLPYDLILSGKWTLEEMLKYTSAAYAGDFNGDGNLDHLDRYGYSGHSRSIPYFYQGMGGLTSTRDKITGAIVPVLSDDKTDMIYDTIKEFWDSKANWINDNNNEGVPEGGHNVFREGKSLFCYYITVVTKYYDIETFEYGLAILPKYNLDQERYFCPSAGSICLFPANLEDEATTGYLYEALNEASYRITYPANIQEAVDFEMLTDEKSIEVQKLIDQSLSFDILKNFDPTDGGLSSCAFFYQCLTSDVPPSVMSQSYKEPYEMLFEEFFSGLN